MSDHKKPTLEDVFRALAAQRDAADARDQEARAAHEAFEAARDRVVRDVVLPVAATARDGLLSLGLNPELKQGGETKLGPRTLKRLVSISFRRPANERDKYGLLVRPDFFAAVQEHSIAVYTRVLQPGSLPTHVMVAEEPAATLDATAMQSAFARAIESIMRPITE